jgi:hypothetical protein
MIGSQKTAENVTQEIYLKKKKLFSLKQFFCRRKFQIHSYMVANISPWNPRRSTVETCYYAVLYQMSIDFAPILQKNFLTQEIPGLLVVLDDSNGRVQDEATEAVVTFF